ncbi:hypothetical protein HPB47_015554, partial [Ixodes persulcatus]
MPLDAPEVSQEDEVVCAISLCVSQQELVEESRQNNHLQHVIALTTGTWPPRKELHPDLAPFHQ